MNTKKKVAFALAVLMVLLLLPRMSVSQQVPSGIAISVEVIGSDETQILGSLNATYQTGDEYPVSSEWYQFAGTIQTSEPDVWAFIIYTFNVTYVGNLNLSAIVTAYGNVNHTMMAYNWTSQTWNNLTYLPAKEWTNVTFNLPSNNYVAANGTSLVGFYCVGHWYVPCAILVDYINIGQWQGVPPTESVTIEPVATVPIPPDFGDTVTSVLRVIADVVVKSANAAIRAFLFWLV